jgi:DNA-binding transcriptional LysR family regulator
MSLAALDLNLLVALDVVLAERSVARAAERLHVTPSAISNALARLRAALDDPLVLKSGRGIVPTPRALALAPALARALAELDAAVHGSAFDPRTSRQRFTLALSDAGQIVRLPPLASQLTAEMPHARLRVVGVDTMVALGGLAGTEVDVAIGVGEKAAGIHRRPLFDEPTVLVARRDHPALGARAGRRALRGLRHVEVHVAFGRPNRDIAASYARAAIEREVVMVVPTFTAALSVVAATDLVATLPASVVATLGAGLGVRAVAAPLPPTSVKMYLVIGVPLPRLPALDGERVRRPGALPARPGAHRGQRHRLRAHGRQRQPRHLPLLPGVRSHRLLPARSGPRRHRHPRRRLRRQRLPVSHHLDLRRARPLLAPPRRRRRALRLSTLTGERPDGHARPTRGREVTSPRTDIRAARRAG